MSKLGECLSLHVAILLSPAGPRPDHSESLHEHS